MIQGISHITILVRDLDKTSRLLCDGLGAEEIYDSQDRHFSISREKYFLLGGIWLVAMQGAASEKSYRHIAFQVEKRHLTAYQTRLTALGATIVPSRSRVEGEGASVYFYDYDKNLFELHAGSLEERLERYKR